MSSRTTIVLSSSSSALRLIDPEGHAT
jgi:hypothetical protein